MPGTPARHAYTFGLEEEYFLARGDGRPLRAMPRRFFEDCRSALGARFGSELLQSQVEVQTGVHDDPAAAERDLRHLRRCTGSIARQHGLAIFAAGTHPSAAWRGQLSTDKPHYDQVMDQLQMLGHRNLLCGLHVHVQPADASRRVGLMARMQPFLPLLLALSTSSPFWLGQPTGLMGYRQTAYQEIPRTGLPPLFRDQSAYDQYVRRLVDAGAMPDAGFLWWALRPSHRFPTLELRVTDACTRLHDALAIAQLFRCLVRRLECQPRLHADLGAGKQALVAENLWRAQRHGFDAGLIDLASGHLVPVREMLEGTLQSLAGDIEAFACQAQMEHLRRILQQGTSAHHQLQAYHDQRRQGATRRQALAAVTAWLIAATGE